MGNIITVFKGSGNPITIMIQKGYDGKYHRK